MEEVRTEEDKTLRKRIESAKTPPSAVDKGALQTSLSSKNQSKIFQSSHAFLKTYLKLSDTVRAAERSGYLHVWSRRRRPA